MPLCRVVDPQHARGMSEFVTWGVLHFYAATGSGAWQISAIKSGCVMTSVHASTCTIGVMGLGEIGTRVSVGLAAIGFARARLGAQAAKICRRHDIHSAVAGSLPAFLQGTDILVCLLPLTR